MAYLPHTEKDVREILGAIGLDKIEDLVAPIPPELRLNRPLDIPLAGTEQQVRDELEEIASRNLEGVIGCFLGAGAYPHYVPSAVNHTVLRQEFLTAYTPYQPEIAQGTLQAMFEFQTLVCQLTGMDISNASLYDGSTALAEAALMARRVRKGRGACVLSAAIHPEYRQVVKTYLEPTGVEVVEVPVGADGRTDWASLPEGTEAAAVAVQSPNFFGVIEDLGAARRVADDHGGLLVATFGDPLSLAILKPAGEFGADIVCGDFHGFGTPVSFGGPFVGILTAREEHIRQMPGRLIGQTVDTNGHVGYVMTLTTREQHIRREKATSNICTNQGLIALRATIYLSLLGKSGLTGLARRNLERAEAMKRAIREIRALELPYESPTFNEFVVRLPRPAEQLAESFHSMGVVPGLPLSRFFPDRERDLLVCVTEMHSDRAIDTWLDVARGL